MGNRYSLSERIKKRIVRNVKRIWYYKIKRSSVLYARALGVRIGENCQIIGDPEIIFGSEPWLIKIGNHVDITYGVEFLNHEGGLWCAREYERYEKVSTYEPIVIGNNVMIGVHSLIMPGVKIGDNVIVAAHSVITKDVESGMIVSGVPAKPISNFEKFIEKLKDKELFEILDMTQEQKKKYLLTIHPEWFE